jgi:hypothetical protein
MLVMVLCCPRPAVAEPSAEDRKAARALVIEGRAKLAAHDNEGARKAFAAAHAIMGVPTTGLDLAKAQQALGLLIEARATALEVVRMPVSVTEPEAFTNARPLAAELAAQLAARIPSIVVTVTGLPVGAIPRLLVDGVAMPASMLSQPQPLDPGPHAVEVSAPGFASEHRELTLAEGASIPLDLALRPLATPTAELTVKPLASAPVPPVTLVLVPAKKKTKPRAWPWVAGGAGVVALGVGSAFVIDYARVRGTVSSDCPGGACNPHKYTAEDVANLKQRWNRDLGLFVGLGIVGAAGVGIAIAGLMKTAPRDDGDAATTAFAPWVSAHGGGAFMTRSF